MVFVCKKMRIVRAVIGFRCGWTCLTTYRRYMLGQQDLLDPVQIIPNKSSS